MKVGLEEVTSWLGCGWVDCGGFSISFLGYPLVSRACMGYSFLFFIYGRG